MNENELEYRPLIPIGVHMRCGQCGTGYLESANEDLGPTYTIAVYPPPPPSFLHKCTEEGCDNQAYLEEEFPAIEYDLLENYVESMG